MRLVDIAGEVPQKLFEQNGIAGVRNRDTVVEGVQLGEFAEMLVHHVSEADQRVTPLIHGQCHPLVLSIPASGHRSVHLGGTGQRDGCIDGTGARIDVGMRRCGRDPVAADEQSDRLSHEAPSSAHSWITRSFCSAMT